MNKHLAEMIQRLVNLGVSVDDAWAMRRVSMTLHRWHELECGDGNSYGSWAIERDEDTEKVLPNGVRIVTDGKPFLVHHHYAHGHGKDTVSRTPIADRERGAQKRLAKIMARYPGLTAYVQGDPRGCALYIIQASDVPEGATIDSCYSRGLAVFK